MSLITILMSTYNGENYLREQIDSIINQRNVNWRLIVRDDGSGDATQRILSDYSKNNSNIMWYQGDNLGPAYSFMDLIKNAPESDYYALCDQDDVWKTDKMSRAITALSNMKDKKVPSLYCSNYQMVDASLNNLPDNGHITTTEYGDCFITSNCTGCTVVFNNVLQKLLQRGIPSAIVMHDDWIHKVCLAVGGVVKYDSEKTIMYRQHGDNVASGSIRRADEKIRHIIGMIFSHEHIRYQQFSEILEIYEDIMPIQNVRYTKMVLKCKHSNVIYRIKMLITIKCDSPYISSNIQFILSVLLNYF